MKKFMIILVLVALAAIPASANVTISSTQSGNTVTLNYVSDSNLVRAFALDISVSTGHITAVDCTKGGSTSGNTGYYVYPGGIKIANGTVTDYNSCVCNSNKYPYPAGTGIGTSMVTIEMGSLYPSSGVGKPSSAGSIVAFTVDTVPCTATIAANSARGGVVMENPDQVITTGLPQTIAITAPSTDCYPNTKADYALWVTYGKPTCWCFPRQCHGDADGKTESPDGKTSYHVAFNDLNILLANWLDKAGVPAGYCADMDHHLESPDGKTSYHVAFNDLNVLLANWLDKASAPGDCNTP